MNNVINQDMYSVNIAENSISIVLNDDGLYNDVAFKVLQNQEKYGLIKCGKLSQNGKIKLVFDTSKYKSLEVIKAQLKPQEFMVVVANFVDVTKIILDNGFIKCENILLNTNTIFVDVQDLSVHLVCVPLSDVSLIESTEVFKQRSETLFLAIKQKFENISIDEMRKIFDGSSVPKVPPVTPPSPPKRVVVEPPPSPPVPKPAPRQESNIKGGIIAFLLIEFISLAIGGAVLTFVDIILGIIVMGVGAITGLIVLLVMTLSSKPENTKAYGGPERKMPQPRAITLVSISPEVKVAFRIDKTDFIIGKSYGNVDGVIENQNTVSRIHCKIIKRNDRFYIQDLGSKNGTYLNNRRLNGNEQPEISQGDRIRISKIEFIVK